MGLFDKLKKKVLKVDDQQLLLEAMLCVAFADGDDQYEETNLVRAFANTLPELKNADAYEVYEKAEKSVKLHGAMTRVKELANLSTEALRQKAPTDLDGLRALEKLYSQEGNLSEKYLGVVSALADHVPSDKERLTLYRRLVAEYEELPGHGAQAVACLEKIVLLDPAADDAYRGLERHYQKDKNWPLLIDAYKRHAEHATSGRAELLAALARVMEVELPAGDAEQARLQAPAALQAWRRVLEVDPENTAAIEAVARLSQISDSHEDAIKMLLRRAHLTDDKVGKVALYGEAARLSASKLGDKAAAEEHYVRALEIDPQHIGTTVALAELYRGRSEFQRAAKLYCEAEQYTQNRLDKTRYLVEAGKQYLAIDDRIKALELFQQVKPDLVALDMRMPHMDGCEVMRQLRQVIPADDYVPILIVTGELDAPTKHKALAEGASDFINKPVDATEVVLRIKNQLQTRRLHNQLQMHNEHLEAQVRLRTKVVEQTQLDLLNRLVLASEYRYDPKGSHAWRVGRVAMQLAEMKGLPPEQVDMIKKTAPLHDVGKIGLLDSLIMKEGAYTAAEWDAMKTHTKIGSKLLADSRSPLLMMAREIALTHHERWDGTGYHRLKDVQTPLSGRIVALAPVHRQPRGRDRHQVQAECRGIALHRLDVAHRQHRIARVVGHLEQPPRHRLDERHLADALEQIGLTGRRLELGQVREPRRLRELGGQLLQLGLDDEAGAEGARQGVGQLGELAGVLALTGHGAAVQVVADADLGLAVVHRPVALGVQRTDGDPEPADQDDPWPAPRKAVGEVPDLVPLTDWARTARGRHLRLEGTTRPLRRTTAPMGRRSRPEPFRAGPVAAPSRPEPTPSRLRAGATRPHAPHSRCGVGRIRFQNGSR